MTRLELLSKDEIPEQYHYLFTEDYLGDRHIFRVWAHNPEILEATLEYLETLYDQPTRYGTLGAVHDLIGRLPQSVILDTRGDEAEVVYTYEGEAATDRPEVAELVEQIDDLQETFVFDCSLVDC